MTVVFNTNIIIDILAQRQPFYSDSFQSMRICNGESMTACITSNTVTDIAYILHRYGHGKVQIKEILLKLFSLVEILAVDSADCRNAVLSSIEDFEDSVLIECAFRHKANYIITRNINDYTAAKLEAITPKDFINMSKLR
ncbi:PIN domain-containing protein [Treponema brennaborense]|uniref:PilT domain-containing protein n=1 Tax=Treponema brennaborense (strain DSM 12168 / CIP 105900 / DD5/3) TaxID=906968 RepID=F4LMX6_TREBD|nr:PIN domain-containing protein [Treponema brennaborense]AEE15762.1 PilT domain-containing protein [Treponema brennaborense DSM 12168]